MKILIVYPTLTHPIDAGNKQWIMSQVEEFRKLGHEVFMLCVNVPALKANLQINKYEVEQTKQYWGDHGFIYNASLWLRLRYTFFMNYRKRFCNGYFLCDDLYPNGLTKYVQQLQNKYVFDFCIVNYYWLTKLLNEVKFRRTAINTHDVFSFKDMVVNVRNPWMCTYPNEEAKGAQRADCAFTLQDEECAYYRKIAPLVKIYNVYCPYTIKRQSLTYNHNLVLLSSSNRLNIEGFEWFYNNIFPYLIKVFPDIKLYIGGYICKKLNFYKDDKRIVLIGEVNDPADLYKYGDIAINPCINGTGLKIKTFEALSYGKIAMTHPHSTIGIFKKEYAPVFNSLKAEEWGNYLSLIWNDNIAIEEAAKNSIDYIKEMNEYILQQYKNFLQV